ncbi:MAG TPA: VanZ family protein [Gemmatimonadales bacterium]|nr:VanZ family protein [Gemmatimonadales bacterium]
MTTRHPRWLVAGAGCWFVVVCFCTLRSNPAGAFRLAETSWHCIVCGEGGVTDTFLNLLLFLPFGLMARRGGWSLGRIAIAACGLSAAIEVTQAHFLVGRDGTVGDVLANTTGAIAGWLMQPAFVAMLRPAPRGALRGAWIVLLLATVAWSGTAAGLRPDLNGPAPWFGQRLHLWTGHDPFEGTLQRTTLDGVDLPNDPLPTVPPADTIDLVVNATRADTTVPQRPVSILRVVDGRQHVQIGMSQHGTALVFESHVRAGSVLLRTPEWRYENAAQIPAGVPWRWEWRWTPGQVQLISGAVAGPVDTMVRPLSVGIGWVLVHPFVDAIGRNSIVWTALWLLVWFGALGWCAGAASDVALAGFGPAGIAGFVAASLGSGLPLQPAEVMVAVLGYVGAAFVARALRRHALCLSS